jgi:hypothetical protein
MLYFGSRDVSNINFRVSISPSVKKNCFKKSFPTNLLKREKNGNISEWPMALQNDAGVLTGRGLMDCLQYYDNCLFFFGLNADLRAIKWQTLSARFFLQNSE